MRVLTVETTVLAGSGHYWWRDWTDKAEGGQAPAKPNLPFRCYLHRGEIFSLADIRESGMAGGHVDWTCEPATKELAAALRDRFPEKF